MANENAFSLIKTDIISRLNKQNITEPTAVQNKVIPLVMENKSLLFQSETGTGKTFAYLLPLVSKLEDDDDKTNIKIVIAAPTFELASQINIASKSITERKTGLFIGGAPLKRQIDLLKEKPQIVIGTPARLVELINLKKLKTSAVTSIIFDETDRMVKKELIESTSALRDLMPDGVQIIGCSATINNQTKSFFKDAKAVIMPKEDVLTKNIQHWAIFAERRDKIDTLRKFIAAEKPCKALIFTSRADQVENIYEKLRFKKIDCMALHAKADKQIRKTAIDRFRSGKCQILVTSDLSARGLDIANITHVIQMDFPEDEDFFIHRSGRTARAGKTGVNVVIGDEYEMRKYADAEKRLGIVVYPKEIAEGEIVSPEI